MNDWWSGRYLVGGLMVLACGASAMAAPLNVVSADVVGELVATPDRRFDNAVMPWLDPDDPIVNPALAALLFYADLRASGWRDGRDLGPDRYRDLRRLGRLGRAERHQHRSRDARARYRSCLSPPCSR